MAVSEPFVLSSSAIRQVLATGKLDLRSRDLALVPEEVFRLNDPVSHAPVRGDGLRC
jgi:hypothetical protein